MNGFNFHTKAAVLKELLRMIPLPLFPEHCFLLCLLTYCEKVLKYQIAVFFDCVYQFSHITTKTQHVHSYSHYLLRHYSAPNQIKCAFGDVPCVYLYHWRTTTTPRLCYTGSALLKHCRPCNRTTGRWGVSSHPKWDSINTASTIRWQHAKEKGQHYKAKSSNGTGQVARVEQEGETTGQTTREGKEEEWDYRNWNNSNGNF